MNAFFSSLVFNTVATALHQPGSVVVGPLRPASCVLVTLSAARRVCRARERRQRVAEVAKSESAKTVHLEKLLAQEIATEQVRSNPPPH